MNTIIKLTGMSLKYKIIASVVSVSVLAGGTTTAVIVHKNYVEAGQKQVEQQLLATRDAKAKELKLEDQKKEKAQELVAQQAEQAKEAQAAQQAAADAAKKAAHQALLDQAKAAAGSNLAEIKSDLVALHYAVDPGNDFTDTTYCSIQTFQGDHGLKVDGQPGSATYDKLEELVHPATSTAATSSKASSSSSTQATSTSSSTATHKSSTTSQATTTTSSPTQSSSSSSSQSSSEPSYMKDAPGTSSTATGVVTAADEQNAINKQIEITKEKGLN